jgi:hypothetical protein
MDYLDEEFFQRHKKLLIIKQQLDGIIITEILDFSKEEDRDKLKGYNIQSPVFFKLDLYDIADFYIRDNEQNVLAKVNIVKTVF